MATQEQYRRCLKQLAADPPNTRAALIRSLLPGIERARTSGQNLKDIWEALQSEGLQVRYHTFYMVVWRAKRNQPRPAVGENTTDLLTGGAAGSKNGCSCRTRPAGKPKAIRGKQAWVSLAGYTEPENAGAWNGCLM